MDVCNDSSDAAARVTVPHNHDILLGRGGGVNSHVGNRRFRCWISERKEAYTRAKSKKEKGQIARDVVDLVHGQCPPGRFLQHERAANYAPPTSTSSRGYGPGCSYVEINEVKALAKTAQALREGAPNLRAHFALSAQPEDHEGAAAAAPIYAIGPKTLHIRLSPRSLKKLKKGKEEVCGQEQNLSSELEIEQQQQVPATVSSEGEDWSTKKTANDADSSKASGDASEKRRLTAEEEEEKETDASKVAEDCFESAAKKQKHDHRERKYSDLASEGEETIPMDSPTRISEDTPKVQQDDTCDRLHTLATTCALTQCPSPVEVEEDKTNLLAPPLTPESTKSTKVPPPVLQPPYSPDATIFSPPVMNAYPAMLQSLAMEVALPSAYENPCFSAELLLSPLENVRLKKERTVQEWLIMAVPHLHTDDIRAYTRRLVDDGFDSVEMLEGELLEEDLDFMKKAHKRSLLRVQTFLQHSKSNRGVL